MRRLPISLRDLRGGRAPGDASADEAFGQIAAGHIKMTESAAQLSGGVEAWDRRTEGVDDALALVVARPTLGVGDERPERGRVEGRLGDWHHAAGGPAELGIVAAGANLVPACDGVA